MLTQLFATVATDRNYGQFKSMYRKNLSILTEERITLKKAIQPIDIPSLIFGCEEIPTLKNAFEMAFGVDENIKIWATIGINPFNRKCLTDTKVKHEVVMEEDGTINVDADPLTNKLLEIEDLNKNATELLMAHGLNGKVLRRSAPRNLISASKTKVTAPQSRERQDLLMHATTAGSRFHATGGEFLNSDDFFISQERKKRQSKVNELEQLKKNWLAESKQEEECKRIIEFYKTSKQKDIFNSNDAKNIQVKDLKTLY